MADNGAVNTVDTILHGALFEVVEKAVFAEAAVLVPLLGVPVVSSIFSFFLHKIMGLIYTQLDKFIVFNVIDAQVGAENAAYTDSIAKLKTALTSSNKDELKKARDDVKTALSNLIRIST